MNPCPCGWWGDLVKPCGCTDGARRSYRGRLSGPLLDRIDLHVPLPAVPWSDLEAAASETSAAVRERVARVRSVSARRRPSLAGFRNADLSAADLDPRSALEPAARRLLESAVDRLGLSVRALYRCLRVARTIADLAAAGRIGANHLAEAVSYRLRADDGTSKG
jgi:magnesium chelatase family protein